MPSDAKKREQQRKKDAAKARQAGKKIPNAKNDDEPKTNGTTITPLSPEGISTYISFLLSPNK